MPKASDISQEEKEKLIQLGLAVIKEESRAISALIERVNGSFATACQFMLQCKGRIVVIGMGKSGHIGSKIAATLASTGSPSFFVHPGEASHGDLGMITERDVVLALSNSGETAEILTIVPLIKRLAVPLISMTGNPASTLSTEATVNIDVSVEKEACPLGLAPTSSTTAALVMGDALAIALLEAKGFTENDFAMSHPGGSLGKKLLLRVKDIMHTGDEIPMVSENALLKEALFEISQKGLGMTAVVNETNKLVGIFTDGDLRRALDKDIDCHKTIIADVMTKNGKVVNDEKMLAAQALQIMEENKINGFIVVDAENNIKGVFNMHDLLRAGVV